MDFSVVLIGLVTISVLVLPFFVAAYSNKNSKNKLSNNFLSKSKAQGLNITDHDVLYDAVIGIDPAKNILFYFNIKENYHELVDIKNVLKSSVKQHTHTVGAKKNAYTVIDKIELELLLNIGDNSVVSLKFYDNEVIYQLNGELQIADKWQKLTQPLSNTIIGHLNINQGISTRKAI